MQSCRTALDNGRFAGYLITLFLFWELMALFSTVVVWSGGTPAARAAGIRYAIMHLTGVTRRIY